MMQSFAHCRFQWTMKTKNQKHDSGTPEEFLLCRLVLNEQMKNHGCSANYDMVMNLAQANLVGRSLEAFLNERNKKQNTQDEEANG
jgi:hypothetical protein